SRPFSSAAMASIHSCSPSSAACSSSADSASKATCHALRAYASRARFRSRFTSMPALLTSDRYRRNGPLDTNGPVHEAWTGPSGKRSSAVDLLLVPRVLLHLRHVQLRNRDGKQLIRVRQGTPDLRLH